MRLSGGAARMPNAGSAVRRRKGGPDPMIVNAKTGKESFVGATLHRRDGASFNDGYDCTFLAVVWDAEAGCSRSVRVGDSMTPLADCDRVTLDATPEIEALYAAEQSAAAHLSRDLAALRDAEALGRGKSVLVVRGRKVPKGTTGRIFWYGDAQWGKRVGIETANGDRLFTAATNVEVVLDAEALALRGSVTARLTARRVIEDRLVALQAARWIKEESQATPANVG
ncbi:MAG: hypothetical protein ACRDGM_06915 [bacterium]